MKHLKVLVASLALLAMFAGDTYAGGGKGGGRGGSRSGGVRWSGRSSPGTGSKSTSTRVRGYTTSRGTTVQSHRRSTPDGNFRNNYSTRGNVNPYTDNAGTRTTRK
jgi:hypothetical protein